MSFTSIVKRPTTVWFAAGGGIKKAGPFYSEIEAWKSMVLTDKEQQAQNSIHPKDTRVWPEIEDNEVLK